jgi:hypothetical protein
MRRVLAVTVVLASGVAAEPSFFAKNCYRCHSHKVKAAGLNLESAEKPPQVWNRILEKISTGQMPPPGQPAPAEAEIAAVMEWIRGFLKPAAAEAKPDRVTARRLNRVEYNNTLRDLLAVSVRPADEFPVDDSGYGFDNIGDVLTVSPMLMEKYVSAANRVSKLAIYGETVSAKPTRLARLLNRRSPDVNDVLSKDHYFPYSMRGAMYGRWTFPVDAEYEFRLRIANFRPDPKGARAGEAEARNAAPPRKLVLTVDSMPVISDMVEGTASFGYSRGEFTARVPVKAGNHAFRASFPELADLDDPRQNLNPDMRRGLFVDYLEIVGPFHPSPELPASYRKVFVCGHAPGRHQSACARLAVESLMRRAYRRPVTAEELESKLRLVETALREDDSIEEGVRLALEAVLVSPNFLFQLPKPREYELASRLSYFLWSTMPDEELFRLASEGSLTAPGVVQAQVRRMLADPKASNLVENFGAQWLQLRNFGRTKPDTARFPTVDDELLDAMRTETAMFLEAVIREDRSILDLIDAPFTFVNGPLARHYGIQGVSGEAFQRVSLDGEQRGGLLTQGAILTVSSYPTRTSPPVRGKWVLENLLGAPPPPPPPDAPVLDESKVAATASMRERLEQHRKDPSCAPCHVLMDPIGFGLESYDAVGAWRTHDGQAKIDTSGTLPDGKSFQGAKDLKKILREKSDAFTRNLTEKLLTFALGRGLEPYDRPAVQAISAKVRESDYRFSSLIMGIAESPAFQGGNP